MKPRILLTLAALALFGGCAVAAPKTIADLTETTTLGESDPFETIHSGSSRKVTLANIRVALSLQPLDSDLTAIAALSTTSFGRGLLTEAAANGASQLVRLNSSGQLPALDGSLLTGLSSGFANPMTTDGDTIIGSTAGAAIRLAGPTGTGYYAYMSHGNGTVASAPSWVSIYSFLDDAGVALGSSTSAITGQTFNGNTFTTGTGTFTLGSVTLNAGPGGTLGTAAFTAATAYQGTLTNSAGLRGALSDETGTGAAVFATSPSFITPILGVASATSFSVFSTVDSAFDFSVSAAGLVTAGNVTITGGTLSGVTLNNITSPVSAQSGTTFDFSGDPYKTYTMSANTTFTTSNLTAGKSITVKITGGASAWVPTFPAWKFVGAVAPASIAIGKVGILTVTSFGNTDANCVAGFAVEP